MTNHKIMTPHIYIYICTDVHMHTRALIYTHTHRNTFFPEPFTHRDTHAGEESVKGQTDVQL